MMSFILMNARAMLRGLMVTVFACVFAASLWAQSARVEGSVTDSSGAAVSGADVQLTAPDFSAHTATNMSGQFAFPSVKAQSAKV